MESNYKQSIHLTPIGDLYFLRSRTLRELISRITQKELESEETLRKTIDSIKSQVLLVPVFIGKPVSKRQTEKYRELTPSQKHAGHKHIFYQIQIEFEVTGSTELFSYAPDGTRFGGTTSRIYQPKGNRIYIEVEVPVIDKNMIQIGVNEKMSATYSLIDELNKQISKWSSDTEKQIETEMQKKRS